MLKHMIPAFAAALSLALLTPSVADAQSRSRGEIQARRTPNSEEALAGARAAAAAAELSCQVVQARWVGRNASTNEALYEVACESGPGFLVSDAQPPQVLNCLANAASAARLREEDPDAEIGEQCEMEANTDPVSSLTSVAQAAGIDCTIDDAAWIGRTSDGHDRYEIGCAGSDGYWIEATPNSLEPTQVLACLEVVQAGATCRMTTVAEQVATVARLSAPANRPCDATTARYVGKNENGRFYELACADTAGFMFRTDAQGVFQQAYDCTEAGAIGGGCTLTDPQAIAASAAEAEIARLAQAGIRCDYQNHRQIGVDNTDRMVSEYVCSDRPLGLIAFIGADPESSEAIDCFAGSMRAVSCSLTPAAELNAVLTRAMGTSDDACDVSDFRMIGYSGNNREVMEVKCGETGGFIAELAADRMSVAEVIPCNRARVIGETCEL